jgi:hypothetical protein
MTLGLSRQRGVGLHVCEKKIEGPYHSRESIGTALRFLLSSLSVKYLGKVVANIDKCFRKVVANVARWSRMWLGGREFGKMVAQMARWSHTAFSISERWSRTWLVVTSHTCTNRFVRYYRHCSKEEEKLDDA